MNVGNNVRQPPPFFDTQRRCDLHIAVNIGKLLSCWRWRSWLRILLLLLLRLKLLLLIFIGVTNCQET